MIDFKRNARVVCKDGFSLSVQASEFSYCTPRITGAPRYTEAEVGFPSNKEPLLMPYIDGGELSPTENVYGWVPAEVIQRVIQIHGGRVSGDLPRGI